MTYAGNPANLADVRDDPRYRFRRGDICDAVRSGEAIGEGVDAIVNFAAETHVDRSILDSAALSPHRRDRNARAARSGPRGTAGRPLLQVSTDEVYGDVEHGASVETRSAAAAQPVLGQKAGGDLQVLA